MSDSKNIWIINQYASTPQTGMGGRHYYLAQELAKLGHTVYLIASSSNHLLHKEPILKNQFELENTSGFTFVWVKMPKYKKAHSKQRALNWLIFSHRIKKLTKLVNDKPDIVLYSSPSPIAFIGAKKIARYFKCKLVFEVRDIWPLTLTEIGGYSKNHPFIKFMQWIEYQAYKKSDLVISNLENAIEHMESQGLDRNKFRWIPSGFSLDEVSKNVPLDRSIQALIPKNKFIIGYTGTIGLANSMDTLLKAAEILKAEKDIHFILVGNGSQKNSLMDFSEKQGLQNVTFISTIPKVQIQSMLDNFDACFIGWLNNNLYSFGIGANKLPEYLYSGKPIIHAYSGACDPITRHRAGIRVEAENPKKLAEAILYLYKMPVAERIKMGENSKEAAYSNYEYSNLAKTLIHQF